MICLVAYDSHETSGLTFSKSKGKMTNLSSTAIKLAFLGLNYSETVFSSDCDSENIEITCQPQDTISQKRLWRK